MDIVDALTVQLRLDPTNYNEGRKRYSEDRKRLAEDEAKYAKNQQDAQKRTVEGFRTLRNETAGFLFMLAGANSVKEFTANLLNNEAATGRIAENLGLATKRVMAWQQAMRDVGGDPKSANGALGILSNELQSMKLGINTGHAADLRGLGVTPQDLNNPETALLKIASAASRLGRPEFQARARRLGFDADTIYLMEKYGSSLNKVIDAKERDIKVTDDDIKKSQELQRQFGELTSKIENAMLPAVNKMAGAFVDWLGKGDNLNNVLIVTGVVVGGLALAAAAAYAPFLLLAGAIAVVAVNLDKLKATWDAFESWSKGLNDWAAAHGIAAPKAIQDFMNSPIGSASADVSGSFRNYRQAPIGGGGVSNGGGNRTAAYVENYFKSRGYTAAQARGITAAVVAEGGLGARTGGGYHGRALGVGQLLGPRRAAFLRKYGNNFTLDNELEFMRSELHGGQDTHNALGQSSEGAIARALITGFYRPAKGAETAGDMARANQWLGGAGGLARARTGGGGRPANATTNQTTNVGTINVNTQATDANGIARDIRGALVQRGLVVQANTGLNP